MNPVANMPILTVRGLSKSLGGRRILHNLSFDVYPGEIYGFLGPNGSGKTTTIKLILGLLRVETGEIRIDGHNVVTDFEAAVANVGGIIENPEMYSYLSGMENLEQYARMYGEIDRERMAEVVRMVGLQDRIGDKISKYSLGMRQRLGVAQAILHRPKLLILDEPTNGLDPAGIKELRDTLKHLCKTENVAVLVSSHMLMELEQMCDRVGVIDRGQMLGSRSMQELHDAYGDGREKLLLRVGDTARAKEILSENGFTATEHEGALSLVVSHADTPRIVRMLACGVDIFAVNVAQRSLEDAFLEMTTGGKPPRPVGEEAPLPQTSEGTPVATAAQTAVPRGTEQEDRL